MFVPIVPLQPSMNGFTKVERNLSPSPQEGAQQKVDGCHPYPRLSLPTEADEAFLFRSATRRIWPAFSLDSREKREENACENRLSDAFSSNAHRETMGPGSRERTYWTSETERLMRRAGSVRCAKRSLVLQRA